MRLLPFTAATVALALALNNATGHSPAGWPADQTTTATQHLKQALSLLGPRRGRRDHQVDVLAGPEQESQAVSRRGRLAADSGVRQPRRDRGGHLQVTGQVAPSPLGSVLQFDLALQVLFAADLSVRISQ